MASRQNRESRQYGAPTSGQASGKSESRDKERERLLSTRPTAGERAEKIEEAVEAGRDETRRRAAESTEDSREAGRRTAAPKADDQQVSGTKDISAAGAGRRISGRQRQLDEATEEEVRGKPEPE